MLLTKFFHNHFRIRSMDKYPDSRIYRTVPRSARSSPRRGTPDSSRNGSLSKPHQFLTPPDQHGGQVPGEGPYRRRSSIAIRAVKVNIIRFLLLYHCNGERAYRVKISNRARIQPLECRRPVPANDKWCMFILIASCWLKMVFEFLARACVNILKMHVYLLHVYLKPTADKR